MRVAPQYWIWNADGFTAKKSKSWLSGMISYVWHSFGMDAKNPPDLVALQKKIVDCFEGGTAEEQRAMLGILLVAQHLMPETHRVEDAADLIAEHEAVLDGADIGVIAALLVTNRDVPTAPIEIRDTITAFWATRHHKLQYELPRGLEPTLLAYAANRSISDGDLAMAADLLEMAERECSGFKAAQALLASAREGQSSLSLLDLTNELRGIEPSEEDATEEE
jgi:hypothetical protein